MKLWLGKREARPPFAHAATGHKFTTSLGGGPIQTIHTLHIYMPMHLHKNTKKPLIELIKTINLRSLFDFIDTKLNMHA